MEGTFLGSECVNYRDDVVLRGSGQQCKRGLVSSGGCGGRGVGCVKKKRKSLESGCIVENDGGGNGSAGFSKDSTRRSDFVDDLCDWLLGKWSIGEEGGVVGDGKRSGRAVRLSGVCDVLSEKEKAEKLFGVLAKGGRLCRRVKKCDVVRGLQSSSGVLVLSTVVSDLLLIGCRFFGGVGGGGRLSRGVSKICGEILQAVYKAMDGACGDVSVFRVQRLLRECYVRHYVPLDVCFALKGYYMGVVGLDCKSGGGGVCEYGYVDEFCGGEGGGCGVDGGTCSVGGKKKRGRSGKTEIFDESDDDDCGGSECYSTDGFVVEDSDQASCNLFCGSSEYSRSSEDEKGGSGDDDDDDSEEFFSCVSSECGSEG
eukprot:3932707-Rhodomonas_salina.1